MTPDRADGPHDGTEFRLTSVAHRVVELARNEARAFGHWYVGSEHLLLGLLEEQGAEVPNLRAEGLDVSAVRAAVAFRDGTDTPVPKDQPVMLVGTGVRALRYAQDLATLTGSDVSGTDHLLIGILVEHWQVAARVIVDLGGDLARLRDGTVLRLSSGDQRIAAQCQAWIQQTVQGALDARQRGPRPNDSRKKVNPAA